MPVHRNSGRIAMVKGSHMTIEQVGRLREGHMHITPEQRVHLSVAHLGQTPHPLTIDGRAKLVASAKKRCGSLAFYFGKRGAESFNWKGGVSAENELARKRCEYASWRTAVFERDDYTCQVCGTRGGALRSHHINNFAEHENERLDVANGVTLCQGCHSKFHAVFSNRHNTLQELQTFVMAQEA